MAATAPATAVDITPVQERLARLVELSAEDTAAAQRDAWAWLHEVGRRIQRDRESALSELSELFRAGTPSEGIEGQTQGMLVGFTLRPGVDRALAGITAAWMPWLGKRFDSQAQGGDNVLLSSAKWPARLLWPFYDFGTAPGGLAAFDFVTRVEPGALDPDRDVLVIDYAPVEDNPALLIRQVRDELVELAGGVHLGKMIIRWRGGRNVLAAYFALKVPVSSA